MAGKSREKQSKTQAETHLPNPNSELCEEKWMELGLWAHDDIYIDWKEWE